MRTWTVVAALAALFAIASQAQAQDWCGFHDKSNARVHCGFSSYRECHDVVGKKNVYCVPNPEFAGGGIVGNRMTVASLQDR